MATKNSFNKVYNISFPNDFEWKHTNPLTYYQEDTEVPDKEEFKESEEILVESSKSGTIKVRALTADRVTKNKTLYPSAVLQETAREITQRFSEGFQLLGEIEHPSDRGSLPDLGRTAFKWNKVYFSEGALYVEGQVIPTPDGQTILTLIEHGVQIPFSIRGHGSHIQESDVRKVQELFLMGLDSVARPSDVTAKLLKESEDKNRNKMNAKDLLIKLMTEFPEYFRDVTLSEAANFEESAAINRLNSLRASLRIGIDSNLAEAIADDMQMRESVKEQKAKGVIAEAISIAKAGARYGNELSTQFKAELDKAAPSFKTLEEANRFIDTTKQIYSGLAASSQLGQKGFNGRNAKVDLSKIQINPAIEETGTPEFAEAAFQITESVLKSNNTQADGRTMHAVKINDSNLNRNDMFAAQLLKKFDSKYQAELLRESEDFKEAQATADLNLPYTVSRSLIALAVPTLIASSIFDTGVMQSDSEKLWFDTAPTFETGFEATVTDEAFVIGTGLPKGIQLAHKKIKPGSVVIANKVEGTAYEVDYDEGILWLKTGYTTDVAVSYVYYSMREGEMSDIQRIKQTLSNTTITALYNRLGVLVPRETVAFSRASLGLDFMNKLLSNLAFELAKIQDTMLIKKGMFAAKTSTHAASTFSVASTALLLAGKLNAAANTMRKAYYEPTFHLVGLDTATFLSTIEALTTAGNRAGTESDNNGFIARLQGVPVYATTSTAFTDFVAGGGALTGNQELVQHRVFEPYSLEDAGYYSNYSNGKRVDAREWFVHSADANVALIKEKGLWTRFTS